MRESQKIMTADVKCMSSSLVWLPTNIIAFIVRCLIEQTILYVKHIKYRNYLRRDCKIKIISFSLCLKDFVIT